VEGRGDGKYHSTGLAVGLPFSHFVELSANSAAHGLIMHHSGTYGKDMVAQVMSFMPVRPFRVFELSQVSRLSGQAHECSAYKFLCFTLLGDGHMCRVSLPFRVMTRLVPLRRACVQARREA
jgi:hypothetical protein